MPDRTQASRANDSDPVAELRRTEFARLDRGGHVYLDYTGGGLYADSQLREHLQLLETGVYGNPHSINPTSAASTELVESARASVLQFFRASPEEYVAIFTPERDRRASARRRGVPVPPRGPLPAHLRQPQLRQRHPRVRPHSRRRDHIRAERLPRSARRQDRAGALPDRHPGDHHNLFAYPAQSNFSGVHHALEWIDQAQSHGWDVLLDAAAYVPTNRLDLSRWHPDFVAVSFYKMFGWPTGVGCLLARRDALAKLERPWFSGGTIVAAFVQREYYQSAPGAAHFEDGTVSYLNLPAIEIRLRFLDRIASKPAVPIRKAP